MDGFLGIDIGTTNSKGILLNQSGRIISVWKQTTPRLKKGSRCYFNIGKIAEYTDQWIQEAEGLTKLISVGFSSIGESVVPIKDGRAIGMPLVWYEQTADIPPHKKELIERHGDFGITGVHKTLTLGVYKMIWMQENELLRVPDFWLPVCSYLVYRKTGIAMWDTSQAGRSYIYNIHQKKWQTDAMEELGITLPRKVGMLGDSCGSSDGIIYGLGGHDHYVGLYGVCKLYGGTDLFYDSMGSSSVLALIREDGGQNLGGRVTYNAGGGCLVTGFKSGEYVISRAFDYYGRVLECLANMGGGKGDAKFYQNVNKDLLTLPSLERLCRIACPRDYGPYAEQAEGINLLDIMDRCTPEELMLSGYLYLALGTNRLYTDLGQYCGNAQQDMPYFAGGGITGNKMFMEWKASALGRKITVLQTAEISALGAAISGICACGRGEALKELKEKLSGGEVIEPRQDYREYILEMKRRYEGN